MPRYFFNTRDGGDEIDDQGLELPDAEAARREAVRFGAGLLSDQPDLVCHGDGLRIEAVDEDGNLCATVIVLAVLANTPDIHHAS